MKTLTGVLALMLALMFGASSVVIAAEAERKATPGVEMKQPATGEKKTVAKASPKLVTGEITGKVTGVDPTAKTFTVMAQGRAITFSAARLSKLPTVGKNIDVAFAWNPDELPMATSTTESGSTAGRKYGGNKHCYGHQHDPLASLNVCQ